MKVLDPFPTLDETSLENLLVAATRVKDSRGLVINLPYQFIFSRAITEQIEAKLRGLK